MINQREKIPSSNACMPVGSLSPTLIQNALFFVTLKMCQMPYSLCNVHGRHFSGKWYLSIFHVCSMYSLPGKWILEMITICYEFSNYFLEVQFMLWGHWYSMHAVFRPFLTPPPPLHACSTHLGNPTYKVCSQLRPPLPKNNSLTDGIKIIEEIMQFVTKK